MAWYVDPALNVLREQTKRRYPGVTIYTIGDEDHASSVSDHNPDPDGSVDAIDVMLGKAFSAADAQAWVNALVASRDRRLKYIIWDRHIIEAGEWVWKRYYGSNPHTDHPHVSRNDRFLGDLSEWDIESEKRDMKYIEFKVRLPLLEQGTTDDQYPGWNTIGRVQDLRGVAADGVYGPATADSIKKLGDGSTGKTIGEKEYRKIFGLAFPE